MDNISEILKLCRLCLDKTDVNTSIFGEQGELRQIFLKISACLPVKVSKEDNLPKKICDGCLCKLEMLYQFWNSSSNAEKKLIKWLDQIAVEKLSDNKDMANANSSEALHSIPTNPVVLKQEILDLTDSHSNADDLVPDDLNISNDDDDQDYLIQPQDYQSAEFEFQQEDFETVTAEDESSNIEQTRKRQNDSEDEDDPEEITKIAKTEEESDDSTGGEPEPTTFVGIPTADDEQPGPSGVGKPVSDAPSRVRDGKNASELSTTKKNKLKCIVCSKKFETSAKLEQHCFENHELEKRKLKVNAVIVKEEIVEEELNLTFSTDDEEDELEFVFNDGNEAPGQMERLLSLLNSCEDEVEGCCVLCNTGKVMVGNQLKRHYQKHEQLLMHFKEPKSEMGVINIFYCHICKDGKVMTKKELKEHYETKHDTKITNNKNFFKKARCKRPRSPRPEVFRCEICSEIFPTKNLLEQHFNSHDDQYLCDVCSRGFKKLIEYTFHMQSHNEDKLFLCPLCEFSTDKGYLVKSHLYSVHDQFKKYKCELCGKGFAIFTHFQEHKYFHTGEKPFQCNECGQRFMYTRYLNSHKVQMHKKVRKGIQCPICNKMYSHRNSLNTHMRSHTGSLSICDVCGKTLSSNEKLRLHYRIHTGEKPYKCVYCQKTFKTSSYKAEHERTHTGEKPYECPFCGKGFSQRTSMVIHSRGHTGEKPYFCHLCKKGFAAKSMVTIHLKSCKGALLHVVEDE